MKQRNCYNIDTDKKCFLSSRSAYSIDFWRITLLSRYTGIQERGDEDSDKRGI